MEFSEVLEKRRSVRKYKDTPVPKESILKVLEAARVAPSARATDGDDADSESVSMRHGIAYAPVHEVAEVTYEHGGFGRGIYGSTDPFVGEDVAGVEGDLGHDGSGPQGDLLQRRLSDAPSDVGVLGLGKLPVACPPVFAGRQPIRLCDGHRPAPVDLDHAGRMLEAGVSSFDHRSKLLIAINASKR